MTASSKGARRFAPSAMLHCRTCRLRARAEITSHFAAGPQARWRGASDELYPVWYVRSEQQSQRACGPQLEGARRRAGICFVAAPRRCPTSPSSRRLASARPALAPKCEFISARALRRTASPRRHGGSRRSFVFHSESPCSPRLRGENGVCGMLDLRAPVQLFYVRFRRTALLLNFVRHGFHLLHDPQEVAPEDLQNILVRIAPADQLCRQSRILRD